MTKTQQMTPTEQNAFLQILWLEYIQQAGALKPSPERDKCMDRAKKLREIGASLRELHSSRTEGR